MAPGHNTFAVYHIMHMNTFAQRFQRVVAGMALVMLPFVAQGQDLTAKLPRDTGVVTGKFANGLTYFIRTNHKPQGKVELRLVVNAGSIQETEEQAGLAHFMEHMNFNGTKNFKKNELVSYLQSIGVQFGADLNANTSFDQTIYILPIPTDKPGNLEKGFQIIEDWAHNALLTDKDIDEERGVVLEESRLGKGADDRMLKKFFPKLAQGSLYADRLPIGKDEVLKSFTYDKVRSFYQDWYRPDLQAVIIVGDIDVPTAMKMLKKHFEGLKNPAIEKERKYVSVSPREKAEAMVVTDKETTNSGLIIKFPYTKKDAEITVGDYRKNLVKGMVLSMINRRLVDLSQGTNPPFPFAGVSTDDLIHGYEGLEAGVIIGDEGIVKPLFAIARELKKVKEFGFTETELELARREMLSSIEKVYNERNTTESGAYVEEYIRVFLNGEAFPGITNEHNYYLKMIPGVHLREVNALAHQWLDSKNTFTLVTAPDKPEVKLPDDKTLLALTDSAFRQSIQRDEDYVVASAVVAVPPTPGKVVSQQKEEGFDVTTYTLSNGIQVTIKPTDFKSDEILMKGIKMGGANNYGVKDRSNVHFAAEVMDAMGYGLFSPSDIEKIFAGKKANADMSIGEITDDVNCASTVKDFEAMLQLTWLQMTQPRRDTGLFRAYKEKQSAMVKFMAANPQAAFSDTTTKVFYNNNPLAKMGVPTVADYEKLDLDRAMQLYVDEFGCADGYHFYLAGNVKPETALPLLETYLGSLPVKNKTLSFKDNGVRPVKGNQTLKINKGKEPKSMILEIYHGELPYSEELALKTNAVAEILNIKVIEDLREKMGAIYGGGFYGSVAKEPYSRYRVQLYLPCGPENVEKLLVAAHAEIAKIKNNGPDPKDLDKVKSQWLEKHKTDIKENRYWLGTLESTLFWGMDKNRVLQYESYINKLTPADIKETAKKLFTGDNQFVSILNPE